MPRRVVFRSLLWAVLCTPSVAWAQGTSVTIVWDRSPEPFVLGYKVYVGTSPSAYQEVVDAGNVTQYTYGRGRSGQRYYFAVSAYSADEESPRSAEVSTVVGGPPGGGTPAGQAVVLHAPVVNGRVVSLSWSPLGSLNASEYLLEAGSTPGVSNLYNASVGPITSLTAQVAEGIYYVRVRGRTVDGSTTAPSNEVVVAVGTGAEANCTAPPAAPTIVRGGVDGAVVSLSWEPSPGATGYIVQAGSATGQSDVYSGNVGDTGFVTAAVLPGFSAYVRVIAVNACGQSGASAEYVVR